MICCPESDTLPQLPVLPLPLTGLDLWWVPLPTLDQAALLAGAGRCLSAEEQQRLQSQRLPKGQFQFLFTRVMLRHLLSAYHPELLPAQWHIGKAASGRPQLAPEQTPLSFNLTHSHDGLLFAFSQFADPGIDVEWLLRQVEVEGIAQRYFLPDEYAEINAVAEADLSVQPELFHRFWTLKEAAVKASGLGLARGLAHFHFSQPGTAAFSHQLVAAAPQVLARDFGFWSARHEDYVLAVALMAAAGSKLPEVEPLCRQFSWPGAVSTLALDWSASQSRNSSTNLEP